MRHRKPSFVMPVLLTAIIALGVFALFVLIAHEEPHFERSNNNAASQAKSYKVYSSPHNTYKNASIPEIGELLNANSNPKYIMIFATWCPACRSEMPKFAALNLPHNMEKVAISLDRNQSKLNNYIQSLSYGETVIWYRAPLECENYYCSDIKQAFNDLDIHYYGGVPYTAVYYPGRYVVQDPSIAAIDCQFNGNCNRR